MMQQSTRFCQYQGHQDQPTTVICIIEDCDNNRWVCTKCLIDGLHYFHGDHLLDSKQFHSFTEEKLQLKKDLIQQYSQPVQQVIKELQSLSKNINNIIFQLEQDLNKMISEMQIKELKEIKNLIQQDFCQINDDQIKKVMDNKIISWKYENSQPLIENIVNQSKNIQQSIQELLKQDTSLQQQPIKDIMMLDSQFHKIQHVSTVQRINSNKIQGIFNIEEN